MKKVSSILLAFIMLLSVGAGIPVSTAAASLPKSAVTSIVSYPCGFTANFSKQKNITGYQMQYSTSKKFNTKDTKAVRTTKNSSAVRKLGSSKRYYVRVRTYKKSGKKYTYSAWSSSKPVTTLNKNCPDPAHIKSVKSGNKKFTVTTYKSGKADGYQIRYSTKSNFANAKTVTVKGINNTTLNATGCAAGTKYYVQSRTYRKVNGKTYYSYWSTTTKSVTTNKAPTTTQAKHCTNNNNHSVSCGNMGRWFNSKNEVDNYWVSICDDLGNKYENGQITWEEYAKKCPYGYETYPCNYCGKWTGNFRYR